jgi:hypothetical protein
METLHTLKWCDSKVDKISCIESDKPPPGISIFFLPRLSCLQTVADELDLLVGLPDDVTSKYLAFSSLRPVERGTTLAAI